MSAPLKTSLFTLLIAAAPAPHAEGLGRLFFTPEQRAQIEAGHQPEVDTPDNPSSLTVDGIVQKHGGKRIVWINGRAQDAGSSDERAPESVPVALPGQSQPIKLKVGQKVLLNPSAQQKTGELNPPGSDD